MKIVWSPEAADDLEQIFDFIAEENPRHAVATYDRLMAQIERLAEQPHIGRPGRVAGTRELVVTGTPYIIPYRVFKAYLQIIRIYHAARQWPGSFG